MKKVVNEILKNLAQIGRIENMALISNQTGTIPSVKLFLTALTSLQTNLQGETEQEEAKVAKERMPRPARINLAKALIRHESLHGVKLAIRLKDHKLSSFVLENIGPDESRCVLKRIPTLFKYASAKSLNAFRANSVESGEYLQALAVAKFQKKPLTASEIDVIMEYNKELPYLPDLIDGAKALKRKLTEADIAPGIKRTVGGFFTD